GKNNDHDLNDSDDDVKLVIDESELEEKEALEIREIVENIASDNKHSYNRESAELNSFKFNFDNAFSREEIREFLETKKIPPRIIAEMTGLSTNCVSMFLSGKQVADKEKNLIYLWFLECQARPERLKKFMGKIRTRFIFHPLHRRVLEKFYNMDPYPNAITKEYIAFACNNKLASILLRNLNEKETMTGT
ncbi:Homeobox-containing protein 1-like protein, partial [Dinothrombium tinctorium]